MRTMIGVALAGVLLALLSGCTAGSASSAPAGPVSSPSLSPTSPPADAEDGRTCAAHAIIQTNLYNAGGELKAGLLTEEQYVAVVNTAATDYLLMSGPSWGFPDEVRKIVAATTGGEQAPHGATFDPDGAYLSAASVLAKRCTANGTPIELMATLGG